MRIPRILTASEARKKGYKSITKPYSIQDKQEREWFHNAVRDGQKADMVIVEFPHGVELWKHKSQLDIDPVTGMRIKLDYQTK